MSLTRRQKGSSIGGLFDELNEIVLIVQAGEGGSDSKIFVHELFSAYMRYAQLSGLKTETITSDEGQVSAKVLGKGAGKLFKHEPGKHCCQRVPLTEQKGRKHTSTVSVSVLPFYQDLKIVIPDSDLEIEAVNLGGPGGQHRNKTLSDARVKHIPTGIQAVISGRKFHQNLHEAIKLVHERVEEKIRSDSLNAQSELRRSQMKGGSRSDKRRTYNFIDSRCVDHILNKKTGNIKAVMKGDFSFLTK